MSSCAAYTANSHYSPRDASDRGAGVRRSRAGQRRAHGLVVRRVAASGCRDDFKTCRRRPVHLELGEEACPAPAWLQASSGDPLGVCLDRLLFETQKAACADTGALLGTAYAGLGGGAASVVVMGGVWVHAWSVKILRFVSKQKSTSRRWRGRGADPSLGVPSTGADPWLDLPPERSLGPARVRGSQDLQRTPGSGLCPSAAGHRCLSEHLRAARAQGLRGGLTLDEAARGAAGARARQHLRQRRSLCRRGASRLCTPLRAR